MTAPASSKWRFDKLKETGRDLLGLDLYFEPHSQRYLFPVGDSWIPLAEERVVSQLTSLGYRDWLLKGSGERLTPIEFICLDVQRTKWLAYAAPLAGYDRGRYDFNGEPVLVTKAPQRISPKPGDWPILAKVFENMFVDGDIDQRPHVWGWLKVAIEALRVHSIRPGQALVLAGEAGSGKSLFQDLITEMLGGRSAKPFRYMSGATSFNSELFQAEHLIIEDEVSSFYTSKRVEFGAKIKEITVNLTHSCHAKHKGAVQLKPLWRLSISLNDEPEHLQILPPIDDSIADKLMLLHVYKRPMPMPTRTPDERAEFRRTLSSELPAFVSWLLSYEIPRDLWNERYGVQTFHHPDVLEDVENLGPEMRLLEYLRMFLPYPGDSKEGPGGPWEGTAAELSSALQVMYGQDIRSILSWNGAAGTYISRLARKFPAKIRPQRTSRERKWIIDRDL
jgi:hypothetical protein